MLEACKPGAMLMCFGGTRTRHRMISGIEDAGWEIRDCLMWLYGSGFPKSLDISKAIDKSKREKRALIKDSDGNQVWTSLKQGKRSMFDGGKERPASYPASDLAKEWSGWGTALKPAWEPIVLAMKPLDGTFAQNAEKHGVAGLAIDKGRITYSTPTGRWPSNLLLDEESAEVLDQEVGELPGATSRTDTISRGMFAGGNAGTIYQDTGKPSRFFYIAKADNSDRGNQDAQDLPLFNQTDPGLKNIHPTVKPLELMEKLILLNMYLLKLTSTPTGGIVLDPFMGSGSTLVAAKRLGRPAIGIEKEEAYVKIAIERLKNTPLPLGKI